MTSSEELGSQEEKFLIDFLYADRPRMATLSAQLFDDGHLLSTKKQLSQGSDSSVKFGGSIKIASGETTSTDKAQEAIERQFDATWSTPLDVLRELNERGFIETNIAAAKLGQVVLIKGGIQIIDLRMVQKLWRPIMKAQGAEAVVGSKGLQKAAAIQAGKVNMQVADIIEQLPHTIQMRVFSESSASWCTIDPDHLTVVSDDLTFKHGALIPGIWNVLALKDAEPSNNDFDFFAADARSNGVIEKMMLTLLSTMRGMLGRGQDDYGITPLAIYRSIG